MHKDLGVIVTCNLKVAEQCSHTYIKANKNSPGDEIANVNFCTMTTYM